MVSSTPHSSPLYPSYLPVRPEGFTLATQHPPFDAVEPALRADPAKPELLGQARTKVKQITPAIGLEISGVQVSKLSDSGLDELALLTAEAGVLVLRDQDFADVGLDEQRRIARHFGPLHKHPSMGYPAGASAEFSIVYADEKVGNLRNLLGDRTSYDLWHVDQTFELHTPSTTFFWNLETPASGGGDTAFTSLTAAYDALSPAFAATLEGLDLVHTSASVGEVARLGPERAKAKGVETTHPLVIIHPVTGKKVLFVNPTIARSVKDFKPSESANLLDFLHDHIKSLTRSMRVRWDERTLVVWDQRTAAHSAVPDFDETERRHLVRLMPLGTVPRGVDGRH